MLAFEAIQDRLFDARSENGILDQYVICFSTSKQCALAPDQNASPKEGTHTEEYTPEVFRRLRVNICCEHISLHDITIDY